MSAKPSEQELKSRILDLENTVAGLKQSETTSRQACEKRIRMYIDQASDAMFVSDLQGRLLDCNRTACLSTGYTRAELLTMNVADLEAFDLVITDMTMPNMTGDQLARELLSIRPDLPVILCTGYSEKISAEKTETPGVRTVLMKPLSRTSLADGIRQTLDKSVVQK